MKLTVLGRYSPFAPPGGACLGYLVQSGNNSLLLECGSGVLARLQNHMSISDLKYVILSHLHADHCSDVSILRYAADTDVRQNERTSAVEIYSPDDPPEEFNRLSYKEATVAYAVNTNTTLQLGPFSVAFEKTDHPLSCHAIKISSENKTLIYTGDTAYTEKIVNFAQDADLLLAECSLPESQSGFRGHMTPSDSAKMAQNAGVSKLVLTHFWPFADTNAMVQIAREKSDMEVVEARENCTYEV